MTLPAFFDIHFNGKFEHSCSLAPTSFVCVITPKSVKLICECGKIFFYRVLDLEVAKK